MTKSDTSEVDMCSLSSTIFPVYKHEQKNSRDYILPKCIRNSKVVLIPFFEEFADQYCRWFLDEEIKLLTATQEPFTLKDFYSVYLGTDDPHRLDFLLLNRRKIEENIDSFNNAFQWHFENKMEICKEFIFSLDKKLKLVPHVLGDLNIFIDPKTECAEINILIAEKSERGKGFGSSAISLVIEMIFNFKIAKSILAKMESTNIASKSTFEKLGFKAYGSPCHNNIFSLYLNEADWVANNLIV